MARDDRRNGMLNSEFKKEKGLAQTERVMG